MIYTHPASTETFTAKRFLIVALLMVCLLAQILTVWHNAHHAVSDHHCSICTVIAQSTGGPFIDVELPKNKSAAFSVIYNDLVKAVFVSAFYLAYHAQGPPAF